MTLVLINQLGTMGERTKDTLMFLHDTKVNIYYYVALGLINHLGTMGERTKDDTLMLHHDLLTFQPYEWSRSPTHSHALKNSLG